MWEIQRFALDAENNIVDIRNLSSRKGSFSCPACHDTMIPRMGKVKSWHFAHKATPCSYDTYIHTLAKIRIAEWFNKSPSIILDMEAVNICPDYDSCIFYDRHNCVSPARIQHDLKRYYASCDLEHRHDGFVADIFCNHDKNPIFIEIYVSHECSEEKKASGHRIIEILIDSEDDIEEIVSSSTLHESEQIRLYNFHKREKIGGNPARTLTKYTLFQSHKSYVSECLCRNYEYRNSKAIYEIVANAKYSDPMYHIGKSKAYTEGYPVKDCSLCFWRGKSRSSRFFFSGSDICKLYKKCGTPKWCDDVDARQCPMFRANRALVKEYVEMCENMPHEIWRSEAALFQ